MRHRYSKQEIEFVRNNIAGTSWQDMTDLFNNKFGTELKVKTLKAAMAVYGLKNEIDTKLQTREAWNKGLKGYSLPNRVMKNYIPGVSKHPRARPIGSEQEKKGYIRVKIAQPNVWKYKHILVWEQNNGELPENHIVIFADKNNRNFNPDNLIAVSRSELAVMNRCGLIYDYADATKVGKTIADLKIVTRDLVLKREITQFNKVYV